MADLIDREELLVALHDRLRHPKTPEQSPGIAAAEKLVKKQPAIQPKRGEWIEPTVEWVGNVAFILQKCSACGNTSIAEIRQGNEMLIFQNHYCPNCGADMRGESE